MKRFLLLILLLAAGAGLLDAGAAGQAPQAQQVRSSHHRAGCHRLFTVAMDKRAAQAIYRGTRTVTRRNLRLLGRLEHCQRNLAARGYVRGYNHRQSAAHDQRVYDAAHPWLDISSTWYDDSGATSSGEHFYYGFASCGSEGMLCVPYGTYVEFQSQITGACVTGQAQDHGPYGNAGVDVNQNMGAVLGEEDPGSPGRVPLKYRVLGATKPGFAC